MDLSFFKIKDLIDLLKIEEDNENYELCSIIEKEIESRYVVPVLFKGKEVGYGVNESDGRFFRFNEGKSGREVFGEREILMLAIGLPGELRIWISTFVGDSTKYMNDNGIIDPQEYINKYNL